MSLSMSCCTPDASPRIRAADNVPLSWTASPSFRGRRRPWYDFLDLSNSRSVLTLMALQVTTHE